MSDLLKIHTHNGKKYIKVVHHQGDKSHNSWFEVHTDKIEVEIVAKDVEKWRMGAHSLPTCVVRVLSNFEFKWVKYNGADMCHNADHQYYGWHTTFGRPLPVFNTDHDVQCGHFPQGQSFGNLLNVEQQEIAGQPSLKSKKTGALVRASDIQVALIIRDLYRTGRMQMTISEVQKVCYSATFGKGYNPDHPLRNASKVSTKTFWNVWQFNRLSKAFTRLAKKGMVVVEGEMTKSYGYSRLAKVTLRDFTLSEIFGNDALKVLATGIIEA